MINDDYRTLFEKAREKNARRSPCYPSKNHSDGARKSYGGSSASTEELFMR